LTAGPNYSIVFVEGIFTIDPASLNITADDKVILAGDPLPAFTFTYSGFVADDDETVVFGTEGPGYMLDPEYLGGAGSYQILAQDEASNYTITAVPGTLYVNPSGTGCYAVRPILRCIEARKNSEYAYVAHFEYQNKNATDVYVPLGENNMLVAEGEFMALDQPVLFLSGGGSFDAYFNGEKLIWRVSSLESGRKTSVASEASSSSSRCKKGDSKKSAALTVEDELPSINLEYGAYPNPVTGKLMIRLEEESSSLMVRVLDLSGRMHSIDAVFMGSNLIELDMTHLESGLYLIKLDTGSSETIFRIMKE